MDIFGEVLVDYFTGKQQAPLWLNNNYGEPEEMPVEEFFRNESAMSELELHALGLCQKKILDIGAGVGSHALALQQKGLNITALEISETACHIMEKRGVKKVINQNILTFETATFDTLLLLMNGIGLTENLSGLRSFLNHAKKLLNPGGQLLFDSSNIAYLYEGENFPPHKYYGEIAYQYEYQGKKGDWFNWLYVDQKTLIKIAREAGWLTQVVYQDNMDQYLARLVCSR